MKKHWTYFVAGVSIGTFPFDMHQHHFVWAAMDVIFCAGLLLLRWKNEASA